jgi:uncharacterized protein
MSLQAKLRELFLLDQQVRGMSARRDAALTRQKALQGKLDRLQQQRRELAEQHKLGQAKAAGLEHQARDVETRIARLREQMNNVKNNKEYSALLVEVNTIKLEKGKLEDQALEQMGKVETLGQELKGFDDKVAEQEKLTALAKAEVAAAEAEVGGQLVELKQKRDLAEQEVPEEARAQFNRVATAHDGETMAPVIEESRRHLEYSCGGCYMSIPVERVNALTRGGDQVVICPSCGRILYLDSELKASMGLK